MGTSTSPTISTTPAPTAQPPAHLGHLDPVTSPPAKETTAKAVPLPVPASTANRVQTANGVRTPKASLTLRAGATRHPQSQPTNGPPIHLPPPVRRAATHLAAPEPRTRRRKSRARPLTGPDTELWTEAAS